MSFTCCQMKWSESIRVCAVDNLKQLIFLVKLHFSVAQNLENFISVTLIDFCPIIHFDFLNILFSEPLLRRFLWWRRTCLNVWCLSTFRIQLTLWHLCLDFLSLASTIPSKFICFLVIFVEISILELTNRRLLLYLSIIRSFVLFHWILPYLSFWRIRTSSEMLRFDRSLWDLRLTNWALLFTDWSHLLAELSRFT